MRHASKRAIRASIHASAREATVLALESDLESEKFQSTPPHGRRRCPTAGMRGCGSFQSTPPHGRRLPSALHGCGHMQFQSTPPHGRRPSRDWIQSAASSAGFNPRLRTGGDGPLFVGDTPRAGVSIHASAREATDDWQSPPRYTEVSIHASAREATHSRLLCRRGEYQFQSTPPHGRRRFRCPRTAQTSSCFNPRLRTGGDAACATTWGRL